MDPSFSIAVHIVLATTCKTQTCPLESQLNPSTGSGIDKLTNNQEKLMLDVAAQRRKESYHVGGAARAMEPGHPLVRIIPVEVEDAVEGEWIGVEETVAAEVDAGEEAVVERADAITDRQWSDRGRHRPSRHDGGLTSFIAINASSSSESWARLVISSIPPMRRVNTPSRS